MVRPITSEKHTPSRPMVSETRAPYAMRENRSRPMRSVPSRNITPPFATAEQVAVGRDQAPQPVLRPASQQPDRVALAGRRIRPAQRLLVDVLLQPDHVGRNQAPLVEDADALRRHEDVRDVALLQRVGRHELRQDPHHVEHRQHRRADQGQAMAHEVAPHELPLRGEVVALPLVGLPAGAPPAPAAAYRPCATARSPSARSGCAGRAPPAGCPISGCRLPSAGPV